MQDTSPMFLKGATYPLELLADANRLAEEAQRHPIKDGRTNPSPEERAYARSTIFTAFNFVESLLIELAQQCLRDPKVDPAAKSEIEDALKNARANISETYKEWPAKLGKQPVHGLAEFGSFTKLRRLRNNLTHPKLDPLQPNELSQDQLLARCQRNERCVGSCGGQEDGQSTVQIVRGSSSSRSAVAV